MKATLTFDMPEEREEFAQASRASDLTSVVINIRAAVRQIRKHEDLDDVSAAMVERIEDIITEAVNSYDVWGLIE